MVSLGPVQPRTVDFPGRRSGIADMTGLRIRRHWMLHSASATGALAHYR